MLRPYTIGGEAGIPLFVYNVGGKYTYELAATGEAAGVTGLLPHLSPLPLGEG